MKIRPARQYLCKALLVSLPLAGMGGLSATAHAATFSSTIQTIVVPPLSLVKVADLDFGTMGAGGGAGRVRIDDTTDARSATGGVILMGGTPSAAKFLGYGYRGQRVIITRPTAPVTLTRIGGGATMVIDQFTLNGGIIRPLNATGLVDIRVGGRLNVAANQMQGSYIGSFPLTITYE